MKTGKILMLKQLLRKEEKYLYMISHPASLIMFLNVNPELEN